MAFVNQRLLDCVSYGTQGGPTWLTRKKGLRSGKVRRNPMRSRPLYRYTILYRNLGENDHMEVINAFNACMGGVFSFRLKDWSDYRAVNEVLDVLGTGAAQQVQLARYYPFGSRTIERPITKPVSGTVTMTQDGAPLTASIDYDTGIASFTAGLGDVLRWSGQFDVPVYFDDDELIFSMDERNAQTGLFLTSDVTLLEDTDA